MANIKIKADFTIKDGSEILFRSPCYASAITGLIIYYPDTDGNETSRVFQLVDAHNNDISDIKDVFAINAIVKVILNITNGKAYIQNADTNAYLESRFKQIDDNIKYAGDAAGNYGTGYKVPQITVDGKGRITKANEVPIPYAARTGDGGLMPAAMYKYIYDNNHTYFEFEDVYMSDDYRKIPLPSDCGLYGYSEYDIDTGTYISHYIPKIYGIYAKVYVDDSKSKKYLIPITDYYLECDDPTNYNIYVKLPERYYSLNFVPGETVYYMIMYERHYEPPNT